MTFTIRHRGAPRPVLCDFRCPEHGKFAALVAPDDSDFAACPALVRYECEVCGNTPDENDILSHGRGCFVLSSDGGGSEHIEPCRCDTPSPWTPSAIRFKIGICATRGNHQKAEHKGWLNTQNLEDGQDFADWQEDREAVHEEMRKELVTEMVKSDR